VAISGWEALSAHDGIVVKDIKEMAVKAAKAALVILINADTVAAKGGVLNSKSTDLAVHAVFIAIPDQPCKRTSFGSKEKGGVFLAELTTPWTALLAPARCAL